MVRSNLLHLVDELDKHYVSPNIPQHLHLTQSEFDRAEKEMGEALSPISYEEATTIPAGYKISIGGYSFIINKAPENSLVWDAIIAKFSK